MKNSEKIGTGFENYFGGMIFSAVMMNLFLKKMMELNPFFQNFSQLNFDEKVEKTIKK